MGTGLSASPLRRHGFRWFFVGQTVSLLGSSMAPVALAFAVLDASHHAGDLGVVLAARMLPLLGFLLIGGAVADRLPRRVVLLVSNLGAALTQGAVATLLLSGHYGLGAVAALEFLNGLLSAFTTPALRGLVPELVDTDQLQRANALLGTVRNGSKVFGPGLSGVLVVATGGGVAIALDALSYLLAAVCLARLPSSSGPAPERGARRRLARELREGWDAFRGTPWLWRVTLAFCGVNLVMTGTWQILGPELSAREGSAATWGLLLSVRGAGMLLMSSLLYRFTVRRLLMTGQLVGVLSALPLMALGAGLPVPWLLAAGFLGGLGFTLSSIGWDTTLQEHVPKGLLSRVSAYDDLFSYLAIPVGQLAVGPVAAAFGPQAVTTVAGLASMGFILLPLTSRAVRRLPHALPGEPAPVPAPVPHPERR
ncbi:MFS transporter [Streptacidiphilus jiangxiensis]|uniref:Predicted arabinose efflux permease, MFS family n=1 Tax=Streptacidiphilus jiangxiensis TaxID=235985 RepID=A0A1H7RD27_STRJI|nr:MFS transporter [Streptacidiphilus jiangxiensis]SEL57804.1 Predicted arabinose efflux permease, MFS family [Streptacidiphilus jiangxiensis]